MKSSLRFKSWPQLLKREQCLGPGALGVGPRNIKPHQLLSEAETLRPVVRTAALEN
jgi:hypothetical protein